MGFIAGASLRVNVHIAVAYSATGSICRVCVYASLCVRACERACMCIPQGQSADLATECTAPTHSVFAPWAIRMTQPMEQIQ